MSDPTPGGESFSLGSYREYLRSLALTKLDPRQEAAVEPSDVVRETLLNASRVRAQFRGQTEQELVAWLGTIFDNTLASALRSGGCQKAETDFSLNHASARCSTQPGGQSGDPGLAPGEVVGCNDQLLALAAALARLPDEQRAVLEMKHLCGLSVAEIGEQAGRTKAAVVSLLYHGTKALRVLLDDPGNTATCGHP